MSRDTLEVASRNVDDVSSNATMQPRGSAVSAKGLISWLTVWGLLLAAFIFLLPPHVSPVAAAQVGVKSGKLVNRIIKRGEVRCGVNAFAPGFGFEGPPGHFEGFDIDFCGAVAAAVFGDPTKVAFVPLTGAERFPALKKGVIDVLIRNTTHTLSRDAELALNFGPTIFHDGQGFMTDLAPSPMENLSDLAVFLTGKDVCVTAGTTYLDNLEAVFGSILNSVVIFGSVFDAVAAYDSDPELCDAVTADVSILAAARLGLSNRPTSEILPVLISKEPLAPVMTYRDQQWNDIVTWVVYATFFAEEHGITSANVDVFVPSNLEEALFLGDDGDLGSKLGLPTDWAKEVIAAVGNYAEIYDNNLSPILPRGPRNESFENGGLLMAPPFR